MVYLVRINISLRDSIMNKLKILSCLIFKREIILSLIKLVCLVTIVVNGLDMFNDYLKFEYNYKLMVTDNKEGIDLPSISVCTEPNVLFDTRKVNNYFNLTDKYLEYLHSEQVEQMYQDIQKMTGLNFLFSFDNQDQRNLRIYLNSKFHQNFTKKIVSELSFDEMNSLTFSPKELFDCSAKLHFSNESFHSKPTIVDNCFDRFQVLKTIYANKDFGICYTFFDNNYNILLKDDDYLKITIKYKSQQMFMISDAFPQWQFQTLRVVHQRRTSLPSNFLDKSFEQVLLVGDITKLKLSSSLRLNAIETKKSTLRGLDCELKIKKTLIELLSTPYMKYCETNGKSYLIYNPKFRCIMRALSEEKECIFENKGVPYLMTFINNHKNYNSFILA
jgi:hypothetical protein